MARKDSAPPQPPEVTRQQDPMTDYANRAASAQQGAQPTAQANGMDFAKQKLASISNDMLELAKVIAVEKPALMPIIQRMAGMGSQLDKLMASDSQGQGSQAVNGAEPPQGSQSAPEAPGAMGI